MFTPVSIWNRCAGFVLCDIKLHMFARAVRGGEGQSRSFIQPHISSKLFLIEYLPHSITLFQLTEMFHPTLSPAAADRCEDDPTLDTAKPIYHLNLSNAMDAQERHITNRKYRDNAVQR
ncbi:hypothetical protein J6590_049052 [Homalodisca vitripennis]|nr:hypothetical protein J6590_049052 [Homalodisca vitripennis]